MHLFLDLFGNVLRFTWQEGVMDFCRNKVSVKIFMQMRL